MLRSLTEDVGWLDLYSAGKCLAVGLGLVLLGGIDFRCRYQALLGYQFRSFPPSLALGLLRGHDNERVQLSRSKASIMQEFSKYDLKRLELYTRNMADYHLITDLLPASKPK